MNVKKDGKLLELICMQATW